MAIGLNAVNDEVAFHLNGFVFDDDESFQKNFPRCTYDEYVTAAFEFYGKQLGEFVIRRDKMIQELCGFTREDCSRRHRISIVYFRWSGCESRATWGFRCQQPDGTHKIVDSSMFEHALRDAATACINLIDRK